MHESVIDILKVVDDNEGWFKFTSILWRKIYTEHIEVLVQFYYSVCSHFVIRNEHTFSLHVCTNGVCNPTHSISEIAVDYFAFAHQHQHAQAWFVYVMVEFDTEVLQEVSVIGVNED